MSSKVLLEIGSEELPARFIPDAMAKLQANAQRLLSEYRIAYKSIKTYATPRRLAILIDSVADTQEPIVKELWGPPLNVCYDSDGNPTKALLAFASNNNVPLESLTHKEKGKGTYVVATISEPVQSTESILPELLKKLVLSLTFPKSMRWGTGTLRYARPIHWILALYNDKKVIFELDGIKSSSMTRGHRFMSSAPFELKSISSYVTLLRNNFVIVDTSECKKIITEEATKLASNHGLVFVKDEELINHVSFLVEYPTLFICSFDEKYLKLPKELLITVMKDHQKYFALFNPEGELANKFIVVSNTRETNADNVIKGAQKVIKARFDDAKFYYDEDIKKPLKDRLKDLKKVVYHEKIGSLYEKVQRLIAIASYIASVAAPNLKEQIITSATLCKADLLTGVVREFPELQGIMGGYYTEAEGYDKVISQAITEHYLPTGASGQLPKSLSGSILSIADKIDNIINFFSIGLSPTATEDPYALKRQATGIVNILLNNDLNITLEAIISFAITKCIHTCSADEIKQFFTQRIRYSLTTSGVATDVIDAVESKFFTTSLFDLKLRLEALSAFKTDPSCTQLITAIKRVNNIASKHTATTINPKKFSQTEEIALHDKTSELTETITTFIKERKYLNALNSAVSIQPVIDNFFDKVLVMHEDPDIKTNRLSLLKTLLDSFNTIADLCRLNV